MLEKRYQRSDDMVHRKIGTSIILVPVNREVGDLEHVYTLNEVAAYIWDQLDGNATLGTIRDGLVTDFEVEEQKAEQDLSKFIEMLLQIRGVEEIIN